MPNQVEIQIIKALQQEAASGTTIETLIDLSRYSKIEIIGRITALEGTNPTLDIQLREYDESLGATRSTQTVPQITGTTIFDYFFVPYYRKFYMLWTIGGTATPKFTFGVSLYGTIS